MFKGFLKLMGILISLGVMGAIFIFAIIVFVSFDLPEIDSLKTYKPPIPSKILSSDNVVLLEMGKENRDVVQIEDVPKKVINAFISAEDDNFYSHSGIDYKGIVRATLINIKAGRVVQGASTITQQVAKSLLLSSERTFSRKIKDLLLAKKIEEELSKNEILFLYLNQVYLGGGYYGIKAAFEGYFDKELNEATIAECALVAGLLVAPGRYSPYINPQYAKKRQKYVLSRLYKTKKISKEEYEQALAENIKLFLRKSTPMKGGYFTDWIRQTAIKRFGKEEFLTKGYTITTSIDWDLQKKAEDEVKEGVLEIDKRQGYKGALGQIEDINEFVQNQREEIYKETSEFFIFNIDGSVSHEFNLENDNYLELEELRKEKVNQKPNWFLKSFEPGNIAEDKMNEFIKLKENYKGVVLKVNDLQRMVYVKFAGGLVGVIPYEYFRWAHERNVTEKRTYWSYLTRPSTMIKENDIVLVKTLYKPQGIWSFIDKSFKKIVKNESLIEAIKGEKYYILSLEQEPDVQGALVSISPNSGRILAMVGGSDFSKSQFNRAIQSNRQPGSAFKPILYAASLENGYHPASLLLDSPSALGSADANLDWKPQNYDGKFKGEMTLRRALETSRNIPTIKLVQDVGVRKMNEFINRFHKGLDLPQDLSISLGSFGINLLDLVKMYAVFPNKGRLVETKSILSITDSEGNDIPVVEISEEEPVLSENIDEKVAEDKSDPLDTGEDLEEDKVKQNPFHVNLDEKQVYDSRLAYLMNNLMKGVIQNGTGRRAKSISSFIGGKTGTTNNYVDAWFLGYSSNIVTGVWTGFDGNESMGFGETGAKSALPIWKDFMELSLKKMGEYDFNIPSGIINISVNKENGKIANPNDKGVYIESFVQGHGPSDEQASEIEDENTDENPLLIDDDYYSEQ